MHIPIDVNISAGQGSWRFETRGPEVLLEGDMNHNLRQLKKSRTMVTATKPNSHEQWSLNAFSSLHVRKLNQFCPGSLGMQETLCANQHSASQHPSMTFDAVASMGYLFASLFRVKRVGWDSRLGWP